MNKDAKIYVAGHNGMVGSAIVRKLKADGYTNILTASSKELNLISQADTNAWFAAHQPDYVFVAAAKVGGIHAN
ncbi:MAG TPA: NAD-dependent epimerase/dehydratase family protein, partial [Chitinophagales bacterium]|nr:NAD-dependent epimerase/dehydratase family protein [Chitinophagales bacterium]